MATTTSITTTYAGKAAGQYIGAALLEQNSLKNGIFSIRQNIKFKEVLQRFDLDSDNLVQDNSCDYTDTGSITLDERIITPKELKINKTICKEPFRNDWDAETMGMSTFDKLPKKFSDFMIARVIGEHMAKTEIDLYSGDDSNNGEFTGVVTRISADANLPAAQEVTGTTVDASNVIVELGKIVDAMPTRLRVKPDVYLAVAPNIYYAYVRALGGFAANGVGAQGVDNKGTQWWNGGDLQFDGVPIKRANGLTSNQAFATYTGNLMFGTGLLSDHNLVKVLDMADLDGSDNVRFIAKYTAATQYGFAGDFVTYGITNSVN